MNTLLNNTAALYTIVSLVSWGLCIMWAYPMSKRYWLSERNNTFSIMYSGRDDTWTIRDMLLSVFLCVFFWWIIIPEFYYKKYRDRLNDFFNKKSPF